MDDYLKQRQSEVVHLKGLADGLWILLEDNTVDGRNAVFALTEILRDGLSRLDNDLDSTSWREGV